MENTIGSRKKVRKRLRIKLEKKLTKKRKKKQANPNELSKFRLISQSRKLSSSKPTLN
jgi:hypothetical protein